MDQGGHRAGPLGPAQLGSFLPEIGPARPAWYCSGAGPHSGPDFITRPSPRPAQAGHNASRARLDLDRPITVVGFQV